MLKALRMVLKLLLKEAPRHVMVVLTGSSMAATWLQTARLEASYTLLVSSPGLDWPASHSQAAMSRKWQALRNSHPELSQELLRWSEPTPAALTKLALDWLDCGRPQDLQAFAADFTRAEFVETVRVLSISERSVSWACSSLVAAQWSLTCIDTVLKQGAHKQSAVWATWISPETLCIAEDASAISDWFCCHQLP